MLMGSSEWPFTGEEETHAKLQCGEPPAEKYEKDFGSFKTAVLWPKQNLGC